LFGKNSIFPFNTKKSLLAHQVLVEKILLPAQQEEMPLFFQPEDTPSWSANIHLFLLSQETGLFVEQPVFLLNKKAHVVAEQEDISSCSTRRDVFVFQQEDMSSC